MSSKEKQIPVSFVGSLSRAHESRTRFLEYLCRRCDLEVWGVGAEALPEDSPIRKRHRGIAWGIDMFKILHQSYLTLNHHIGISGAFANNMRLYEATGVGSLLLTDAKKNLSDLFVPGVEVLSYESPEHCAELVAHYLEHRTEGASIATAGQRRTLADHSYAIRAAEMIEIMRRYL